MKQTLIYQDLDFQKSSCRLNDYSLRFKIAIIWNPRNSSILLFLGLFHRPFNLHLDLWKSRSALHLRKISDFRSCTPEEKSRCAGHEIFIRFETDLDFSRPWFSEIKVQIKRPHVDQAESSHLETHDLLKRFYNSKLYWI